MYIVEVGHVENIKKSNRHCEDFQFYLINLYKCFGIFQRKYNTLPTCKENFDTSYQPVKKIFTLYTYLLSKF